MNLFTGADISVESVITSLGLLSEFRGGVSKRGVPQRNDDFPCCSLVHIVMSLLSFRPYSPMLGPSGSLPACVRSMWSSPSPSSRRRRARPWSRSRTTSEEQGFSEKPGDALHTYYLLQVPFMKLVKTSDCWRTRVLVVFEEQYVAHKLYFMS